MFTSHFCVEYLAGWKIYNVYIEHWCRFSLWYKLQYIFLFACIQRVEHWTYTKNITYFVQESTPKKYNFFHRIFITIWGRGGYFRFFLLIHFWTLKTTFNDTKYFFVKKNGRIFSINNRRTVLIDHRLDTVNYISCNEHLAVLAVIESVMYTRTRVKYV